MTVLLVILQQLESSAGMFKAVHFVTQELAVAANGMSPLAKVVMPALCRASTPYDERRKKTWMVGTSPAMTKKQIAFDQTPSRYRRDRAA
jgi:hypothetical protein